MEQVITGENKEAAIYKTANTTEWVCQNITGKKILDVNCQKGDISISLGREGKEVLGMDASSGLINYAKKRLHKESNDTKKHVNFKVAKFLGYRFNKRKYDSIILENTKNLDVVIKKAMKLLNDHGKIILIISNAMYESIDGESYSLTNLFQLSEEDLVINDIEFFGELMGVILRKSSEISCEALSNKDVVRKFEDNYAGILIEKKRQVDKLTKKVSNLELANQELIDAKSSNERLQEENKLLHKRAQEQKDFYQTFSNDLVEKINIINKLNNMMETQDTEIKNYKETLFKAEDSIKELQKKLEHKAMVLAISNKTIAEKGNEINALKQAMKGQSLEYEALNEKVIFAYKELTKMRNIILEQKEATIDSREKTIGMQDELLESYKKEEKLLKSYQKLLNEHEKISKKYQALSHSKLGKATLSYWKWRKK
ncbi:methyltransferase domain-containing protein [Bacillus wiedmannii]|uniref:methyltransferase domain-containing protein n=1 Tax=Bacillus wiedmannii TaxID=1890302 RepID=UPI000BF1812A|nr:methyltransferase domain-containing protein [Bacillus wiedmannii]PEL57164.1 SAM-dependent methyltransferase [Bacillus wiedmannii]PGD91199.1 SAM-dependent methyltransferase [Bacillus wiedmannii]PHB44210.1 SAM-dependent methyltransferase [Bacillus wiedmannii]PHC21763.1 SAM-dependent methyltransferase [Bacillus wiedmannii]